MRRTIKSTEPSKRAIAAYNALRDREPEAHLRTWQGERERQQHNLPLEGYKLVHEWEAASFGVSLYQRRKHDFVVLYGAQRDDCSSYSMACEKLGQALMHAAGCEGLIQG